MFSELAKILPDHSYCDIVLMHGNLSMIDTGSLRSRVVIGLHSDNCGGMKFKQYSLISTAPISGKIIESIFHAWHQVRV